MAYGNPMSQMADASKLSITQLQVALRNGTIDPQVGQLVLNSKIIADKKAKMAMQAQQPAQPPVAQQNLAYGQGVDTLPSNLPTIGAAQGGIIAFDGTNESLVPRPSVADLQYDLANEQAIGGSNPYATLWAGTKDVLSSPFGYRTVYDPVTKTYRKARDVQGMTPSLDANAAARAQRMGAIKTGITTANDAASVAKAQQYAAQHPFEHADPSKPMSQAEFASLQQPAAGEVAAGEVAAAQDKAPPRDRGGDRGGAFSSVKGYTPIAYDDKILKELAASENNPDTGKPYTYEEIAARNKTRGEKEGIDYGLYEKQAKELEGKKTRSNARIRLDEAMPWFAASEALGKNKSQYAMEGISAGLGAYGKSAIDIADKEEARTEGIRKEGNQLALAQNAFNQATATGNRADLKSAEDALKQAKMNLASLGVKTVDQQNAVLADVFKANAQLQAAQIGANATKYSADKQGRTIDEITAAIMKDNPGMARSEAIKQAYEYSMPGFGATAQRDVASQRTSIVKQIGDIIKKPAFAAVEKQKQDAELAILRRKLAAIDSGAGSAPPDVDNNPYKLSLAK